MKGRIIFPLSLALLLVPVWCGLALAGSLQPSAPPAPTMKTLDQVPPTWDQILPTVVNGFPGPRFQSVMGGAAVLDKETGLVWEKSPDTTTVDWGSVRFYCPDKNVGGRKGWRLPSFTELASLVDPSNSNPALPAGHPFLNVQSAFYWSATTDVVSPSNAWDVYFGNSGVVNTNSKSLPFHVWCVRGGGSLSQY